MIFQEMHGPEVGRQVLAKIEWSSSDPKVVTVAEGVVTPLHDGQATITAKSGDRTATAKVAVSGMGLPFAWSFRNHVEPVLAKLGCNSGACHGALAGKGGFRLSLRGYDPATDYFNIVKQDRGRRVELADPGRSLVLAKPSGAIAHKGGVRFATSALEYRDTRPVDRRRRTPARRCRGRCQGSRGSARPLHSARGADAADSGPRSITPTAGSKT